jgi:hypothetical protein
MQQYDFKAYHMRSINAASAEERTAINEELKALYASLTSEEEREHFNQQLQTFLAHEVGRLKTDYEALR